MRAVSIGDGAESIVVGHIQKTYPKTYQSFSIFLVVTWKQRLLAKEYIVERKFLLDTFFCPEKAIDWLINIF